MSLPGNIGKGWIDLRNYCFPLFIHTLLGIKELLWLPWFPKWDLFMAMGNVGNLNLILCWQ